MTYFASASENFATAGFTALNKPVYYTYKAYKNTAYLSKLRGEKREHQGIKKPSKIDRSIAKSPS